jgi:hypothetical protein
VGDDAKQRSAIRQQDCHLSFDNNDYHHAGGSFEYGSFTTYNNDYHHAGGSFEYGSFTTYHYDYLLTTTSTTTRAAV